MRRGPMLMIIAGLFFAGMLACVKQVRPFLSAFDIIFWRSLIALPLLVGVTARGPGFHVANRSGIVLRALFGFGAMTGYFWSMRGMGVADVTLVGKLQPLVIGSLAGVVLGKSEKTRPLVWVAMTVGFAGCAIVLGPNLSGGTVWGFFAMGGALSSAGAHLTLRVLGRTEKPQAVVFYFYLLSVPFSTLALFLFENRVPDLPPIELWLPLFGVSMFSVLAQWLVTEAYRLDSVTVVAAASYTAPLWAVILDCAVFSISPKFITTLGGALIVGSGLALLLLDRHKDQKNAKS